MFYKFVSAMGRIAPTNAQGAYAPEGFAGKVVESPPLTYGSQQVKFATVSETRPRMAGVGMSTPLSSGETRGMVPANPKYQAFMKIQEKFNVEDGLLVWQKLGRDRALYAVTIGMAVAGTCGVFWHLWQMSWPKQQQD